MAKICMQCSQRKGRLYWIFYKDSPITKKTLCTKCIKSWVQYQDDFYSQSKQVFKSLQEAIETQVAECLHVTDVVQ